eukprot:c15711_g1_i2.p1 GENE.c15711_g1_i2~~c15711_g1_i2.p1  ORF type:complete len:635 (+),score=256.67 c15711_g1_i2:44-1948(+)
MKTIAKKGTLGKANEFITDNPAAQVTKIQTDKAEKIFLEKAGDTNFLTLAQFHSVCIELDSKIKESETSRMYHQIGGSDEKGLNFSQFMRAIQRWRFLSSIVSDYSFHHPFTIPNDYDYRKTTNENYKLESKDIFFGEYQNIRKTLDYNYHSNYIEKRQIWQDAAIRSVAIKTEEQARPWLVYTCGPPGAGKSYALSWMSETGYFPLENIVRIDPDIFKYQMPEWKGYSTVKDDFPIEEVTLAGPRCHKESGFLCEIAQTIAMSNSQNVWVDSTLRDYEWFGKLFDSYRVSHPQYRIAIFYVTAPEEQIRKRILKRAQEEGRDVPESILSSTLSALPKSLEALTPKADLVARIENAGDNSPPILKAIQMVDSTGSWNVIRREFARAEPAVNEFPHSLAPIFLCKTTIDSKHFGYKSFDNQRRKSIFQKNETDSTCLLIGESFYDLLPILRVPEIYNLLRKFPPTTSPRHPVNLDSTSRALAIIPENAQYFIWMNPFIISVENYEKIEKILKRENVSINEPIIELILFGGFVYLDVNDIVISVNSVSAKKQKNLLQFGPPESLPEIANKTLEKLHRWCPVTLKFMKDAGATDFCWILPAENFGSLRVSRFGAFTYRFKDGSCIFFAIASPTWDFH